MHSDKKIFPEQSLQTNDYPAIDLETTGNDAIG
jgi:hypothetical protein